MIRSFGWHEDIDPVRAADGRQQGQKAYELLASPLSKITIDQSNECF
jgi:hypothetical protein